MQIEPQVEEGALTQPDELNAQGGGPSGSNQVKPEAGGKFYPEARRTSINSHWLGTGTRAPHRTPSPESVDGDDSRGGFETYVADKHQVFLEVQGTRLSRGLHQVAECN